MPFCCRIGWKTTLVSSRFTSKAESKYAPSEGDTLVDSLEKAHYFVLGCRDLTICIDHKSLKIFTDWSLNDIPNPKLCSIKEKTLQYRLTMMHVPGVKHKMHTHSAVMAPMIQSVNHMRKHLPLHLPLPTTSKQSHGTESKLLLRVISPCFSFSPPFRTTFLHPSRIFPRIFRNTTNIEMTYTLLIVSFFIKVAL